MLITINKNINNRLPTTKIHVLFDKIFSFEQSYFIRFVLVLFIYGFV